MRGIGKIPDRTAEPAQPPPGLPLKGGEVEAGRLLPGDSDIGEAPDALTLSHLPLRGEVGRGAAAHGPRSEETASNAAMRLAVSVKCWTSSGVRSRPRMGRSR